MSKILIIILFALLISTGCKTAKQAVIEVPVQYKERIVERLVPVQLPSDNASINAFFECDSLNRVIMKQLTEEKSKRVQSLFSFQSGQLNYKVTTVHDTVYIAAKDSFIYKEVPIKVEVPVEVNKLTQWQVFQIWGGRLFFLSILLTAIYIAIKLNINPISILKKLIKV